MDGATRSGIANAAAEAERLAHALRRLLAKVEPDVPEIPDGPGEKERFDRCLRQVLKHEGGWADHPKDPGGATNLGITHRVLAEWRGKPVTKADVKALTVDEAGPIYRAKYWIVAGCDRLPPGVDLMVFDMAVNSGPTRAVKTLQTSVGVSADGVIGPITLGAVESAPPLALIGRYAAAREAFYRSLKTFPTFGRGWLRRLEEVKRQSEAWA